MDIELSSQKYLNHIISFRGSHWWGETGGVNVLCYTIEYEKVT